MTKGPPSWRPLLSALELVQVQNKALLDDMEEEEVDDTKKGCRRKWRRGLTLELRG